MDGSLKISTKKSRETSMSDFEIICRLCNAVNILSNIILEQQSLLKQSDIEKEIRDGLITRYEDVEKKQLHGCFFLCNKEDTIMWFFPTSNITREEHDEFRRRIEQEEERQNRRLELCEMSIKEWNSLTTSVHELAVNMGNMLREQEQQGKRLEALEKRDGEKWRQVTGYVITTLIGAILGVCLKQIGM